MIKNSQVTVVVAILASMAVSAVVISTFKRRTTQSGDSVKHNHLRFVMINRDAAK